jgi:uncharacterized membrane protein
MDNLPHNIITKGRLEALSEGIFSIVMTLLVLELINSNVFSVKTEADLHNALFTLWPKILSYVLSFIVLGVFWVGHHTSLRHLTHTDSRHIWINILFLLSVSFLPFSAAVIGIYYQYQTAIVIYGLNRVVAGLALYFSWWYATQHHRLVAHDIPDHVVHYIARRFLFGAISHLGVTSISFWRPIVSFLLFACVDGVIVLLQIFPSVVNQNSIKNKNVS